MPQHLSEGSWEYLHLEGAIRASGIEDIYTYIYRQQNTVAQYIATRPIIDLCLDTERMMG